jgi:hypothetical protein
MKKEDVFNSLNLVLLLLGVLLAFQTYKQNARTSEQGPIPIKSLTSNKISASDSMADLEDAGSAISVSVKADGKPLSNLYTASVTLVNTGQSPILPGDIVEPIGLKTEPPWRIIAVKSLSTPRDTEFAWHKISDSVFETKRTVLNPGDVFENTVYLTSSDKSIADDSDTPPLRWKARITNLPVIAEQQIPGFKLPDYGPLPIVVSVFGYGIIFLFVSFAVYLAVYAYLFKYNRILTEFDVRSISIGIAVIILALCGAEAGTSFAFGPLPFVLHANVSLNAPVFFLNLGFIVLLAGRYYVGERFRAAPEGQT